MRIISKFHDYYDIVQAEGQDRSRTFVRETVQYPSARKDKSLPAHLKDFVAICFNAAPLCIRRTTPGRNFVCAEVDFGGILFAGKLYPYAEVRRQRANSLGWDEAFYCYGHDELAALLAEHDYDLNKRDKRDSRWGGSWGGHRGNSSDFFGLAGSDKLIEMALVNNLAVASWERQRDILTLNPKLAALQLYRRLDAWQAFQELSMFLGNIAAPERNTVVIEDKYRIPQHGFDKWSFRTMPKNG